MKPSSLLSPRPPTADFASKKKAGSPTCFCPHVMCDPSFASLWERAVTRVPGYPRVEKGVPSLLVDFFSPPPSPLSMPQSMLQAEHVANGPRGSKKARRSGEAVPVPVPVPAPVPESLARQCDITLAQFQDFFCAKAFDVLSDNRYRKFLVKSKDVGDVWAISMQASIAAVQGRVRKIQQLVSSLSDVQSAGLERACKEALASMSPPVKVSIVRRCVLQRLRQARSGPLTPLLPQVRDEWNVCCITGARSQGCIEISKAHPNRNWLHSSGPLPLAVPLQRVGGVTAAAAANAHAGPKAAVGPLSAQPGDVIVHPKFAHFFLMLWYVCKIDHVTRNYTRCWLESRVCSQAQEASVSSLCDEFSSQHALFKKMHAVFCHGCQHVWGSLTEQLLVIQDRCRDVSNVP